MSDDINIGREILRSALMSRYCSTSSPYANEVMTADMPVSKLFRPLGSLSGYHSWNRNFNRLISATRLIVVSAVSSSAREAIPEAVQSGFCLYYAHCSPLVDSWVVASPVCGEPAVRYGSRVYLQQQTTHVNCSVSVLVLIAKVNSIAISRAVNVRGVAHPGELQHRARLTCL